MPEGGVPARAGRDIVLINAGRHPEWPTVGEALAERMGSTAYNILQIRKPDLRWLEENGLVLPSREQLDAFEADGIVFLPLCLRDRDLSYHVELIAGIAVKEVINNAVAHHAGRKIYLCRLNGSKELAEQRRLAILVLNEFDALSIEDFAARCEAACMNDPSINLMRSRFEELRSCYQSVWLEQLDEIWQRERVLLCRMAALSHT